MTTIQAILLGLLQGLSEFLPISSSGHLVLARAWMGIQEIPIFFDVLLHGATLLVILWYFRLQLGKILMALIRAMIRKNREEDFSYLRLTGQLFLASLCTAFIGLLLSQWENRNNPRYVSLFLLINAFFLLVSARPRTKLFMPSKNKLRAILIGVVQGLAVLPGLSRSGITIGTGLLLGLDRKKAGEFSFLLSIPAIIGAFFLTLKDADQLSESLELNTLFWGILAALIAGYAALRFLLWLLSSGRLWLFAFYLIPLGIFAFLSLP